MRSLLNKILGVVFLFSLISSGAPALSAEAYVSDRAQFDYAKRLFDNKDYALSVREFSRVIERFPFTEFKERAHYLTALSLLRDKRYKDAKDAFELFIGNFGKGVYREEAVKGALVAGKKLEQEAEKIPVLRVAEEIYEVASKVHDLNVKIRPADKKKIELAGHLIKRHVNVKRILERLKDS